MRAIITWQKYPKNPKKSYRKHSQRRVKAEAHHNVPLLGNLFYGQQCYWSISIQSAGTDLLNRCDNEVGGYGFSLEHNRWRKWFEFEVLAWKINLSQNQNGPLNWWYHVRRSPHPQKCASFLFWRSITENIIESIRGFFWPGTSQLQMLSNGNNSEILKMFAKKDIFTFQLTLLLIFQAE